MRLHTDTIDSADLYAAVSDLPNVFIDYARHGSRTHERAFEVALDGNGSSRGWHRGDTQTATWDEWGAVMAALYRVDPDAVWGRVASPTYGNVDDFNFKTGDRFVDPGLPADTHKRHTWGYAGELLTGNHKRRCKKCSAVMHY